MDNSDRIARKLREASETLERESGYYEDGSFGDVLANRRQNEFLDYKEAFIMLNEYGEQARNIVSEFMYDGETQKAIDYLESLDRTTQQVEV